MYGNKSLRQLESNIKLIIMENWKKKGQNKSRNTVSAVETTDEEA